MFYLTPIIVLALMAFYLGYLFTRSQLPLDRKLVWAAILVIGHVFSMPVFWYLLNMEATALKPHAGSLPIQSAGI